MEREEFIKRCREAVDLAGDQLHGVVGSMIAHFLVAIAKYESTGMPMVERIPEGLAEAYIALMLIQLKYDIRQEDIDEAIEVLLTKA